MRALKGRYDEPHQHVDITAEHQLAINAGIFDAEGCVTMARTRQTGGNRTVRYTLGLTLYQNHPTPLRRLQQSFGGTISPRREGGQIWRLYGEPMIPALHAMRPLLRVKGPQAEIAMRFQGRKCARGGKYADPEAMRALDAIDYASLRALKIAVRRY